METINIQIQVPSTGQYTLDEFVAKLKDYAEKLASSISKSGNSYQERYMSQAEQKASTVLLMKWKLIRRMGLSRWMLVICWEDFGKRRRSMKVKISLIIFYQEGDSIIIDLLTIYDKGEISNISDEFISFLLDKRENG